jgi:hypothetical protein
MRHRIAAPLICLLAILATASAVAAGGWALVMAKALPVDPVSGTETTIELRMLQHGMTPVSWPRLTVIATDATSGAVVQTTAEPAGPEGSYVATLVFPSAGDWKLTFHSMDLEMQGSVSMHVVPVAAPGAGTPAEAAPVADPPQLAPLALALGVILAVLALGWAAIRSRGARADTQVSTGT